MEIYQLTPIESEKNHLGWKASWHKEEVIIRAKSEKRARRLATLHFFDATERINAHENTDNATSPWERDELVKCTIYSGNEFSKGSEEEKILKPVTHL